MSEFMTKLNGLAPEACMLIGAVICLITGLSPSDTIRRSTVWIAGLALAGAALLVPTFDMDRPGLFALDGMASYVKLIAAGLGLLLLMVTAAVPDGLQQNRDAENAGTFEPGLVYRGEFFAFFLFSLTGVMLTAGASDLVWLFLALELTSLPTYVMVATARERVIAQESAVKYFFLGAMAAAIFLYGFTLIYGATGATEFDQIRAAVVEQVRATGATGVVSPMLLVGVVLAVVGICFKIAAFPMHFYAADVYEGAATPVTAFLAFVPKTAGFVALFLVLSLVAWFPVDGVWLPLPPAIVALLWVLAVVTMTVGNVLGLVQTSVKRALAYSSVAHSGYMIIGLLVGPSIAGVGGDGVSAVLFYLFAYGLATIGSFAVLGCLTARGEEAETFDDLRGLARVHPWLAWIMLLSVMSLLGMPPLIGFVGKVYLFYGAYESGFALLALIGFINSAVSAGYYLRICGACFFGEPAEQTTGLAIPGRRIGAGVAAFATIVLGFLGAPLIDLAREATMTTTPPVVNVDLHPGDGAAAREQTPEHAS